MNTRKAVFAGSWYPADADGCERQIVQFLAEGQRKSSSGRVWVGGIVPHAGWYFSGSIACNVIHSLADDSGPDVILIFGTHLHTASPSLIMTQGRWETPFGPIEIEARLANKLAEKFEFVKEDPGHYTQDNTIELQLPFIKYFFKNTKIVPIGVPPVKTALEIGKAAVTDCEKLGLRVKVIGSTDLTHYGPNYGFTSKGGGADAQAWVRDENDRRIIDRMVSMDPEGVIQEAISNQNACCAGAAAAAIAAGKRMGAKRGEEVVYASSYDRQPGDSFVGYVGMVF